MITTEIFDVLLLVALALIFARVLGHLINKLKQPAVIGEILAGVFLGGVIIAFFSGQEFYLCGFKIPLPQFDFASTEFILLAETGILFLLFISGMETSISKLKKVEKTASLVATGGVILPMMLGIIAGIFFGFSTGESIVIGLILIATSVGVTVRTLMDLNELDTDIGATILGGAVIDDILGIILLAFALGIESIFDAVWVGLRIAIFFLIFLILGLKAIDRILNLGEKINLPKSFLSISLSILLIYSFFANKAGISGIIGAFVAGLLIGNTIKSRKIIDDVRALGYGLFIPLFFVWVGASLWNGSSEDISYFANTALLSIVVIIIAIIGKTVGCGIGAKLSGMNYRESLSVGVGMIPRLELALIIVSSAISHGLLTGTVAHQILTMTILLAIATTLITPFLIKATFKK